MSITAISKELTQRGIKHVVVSATNQVEALVNGVKELLKDCAKAHGPYAKNFQERLESLGKQAYDFPESSFAQDAPQELLDLSKTLLSLAQTCFPKPTLSQLSDHKTKKFYTAQSEARAKTRYYAIQVGQAKTTEDVLVAIKFCLTEIARRDEQLGGISEDLHS